MSHLIETRSPRLRLAALALLAALSLASAALPTPAHAAGEDAAAAAAAAVITAKARAADAAITVPSVSERIEPTWTRINRRMTWFVEMLPVIGLALLVIVVFAFLGRLISRWDLPFRLVAKNKLLQQVLRQVVFTLFVLLGLLLGLEIMDATALVGAVLGTAGIVGLALGFAFKDLVENYLASILLSIRRPFASNDFVSIDGHEGNVVRLTTSDTILMTADGNHLRIPNAKVFNSVMLNFTRNPRRRFDCAVGIATDEPVGDALKVGAEALLATPGVLADPAPFGRVEALGDWTVNLRFFAWVDQRSADYGKAASEGRRRVKTALDRAGVAMPNPTYRLENVALDQAALAQAKEGQRALAEREEACVAEQHAHEAAPDTTIDRQIAEDRATSDEKNLL